MNKAGLTWLESLGITKPQEVAIWFRGVEILGGGDDGQRHLRRLLETFSKSLAVEQTSGSNEKCVAQLTDLAVAAEAMARALNLTGAAQASLLYPPFGEAEQALWIRAAGQRAFSELQEIADKKIGLVEHVAPLIPQGYLTWRYQKSEFTALASLCRKGAKAMADLNGLAKGKPSLAHLFFGSPNKILARACVDSIQQTDGEIENTHELARIVAHLHTKKPLKRLARFAELECREAKKATQSVLLFVGPLCGTKPRFFQ